MYGGGVWCDPSGQNWNGTWCRDAANYLIEQEKPANCPDVTEQQTIGPPWFGPCSVIRSCDDGGLYLKVRRGNDTVVCLGTSTYESTLDGYQLGTCSFYSDSNCTQLAPGSLEPWINPNRDETGGIKCNDTTTGTSWCKVGGDVVLRNLTAPTDCSSTTTIPPTGTAIRTSATTPAPITATATPGPWICVTSCPDRGHSVLVRLTPGGQGVQCQGPNSTMCSWYLDKSCTELAPGEPMHSDDGMQGYICLQTLEGWCSEGWRVVKGGANAVCTTATSTLVTATSTLAPGTLSLSTVATVTTPSPSPTSTFDRPSGASAIAGCGVGVVGFSLLVLLTTM